jgi:hypothetical protein
MEPVSRLRRDVGVALTILLSAGLALVMYSRVSAGPGGRVDPLEKLPCTEQGYTQWTYLTRSDEGSTERETSTMEEAESRRRRKLPETDGVRRGSDGELYAHKDGKDVAWFGVNESTGRVDIIVACPPGGKPS